MRHIIETRDWAIFQTLCLEEPGSSILHAGGGNRCGRLLIAAVGLRDGGGYNLQRQGLIAGRDGARDGEHSCNHFVDNQEDLCEVYDRGSFGSDLALSENVRTQGVELDQTEDKGSVGVGVGDQRVGIGTSPE